MAGALSLSPLADSQPNSLSQTTRHKDLFPVPTSGLVVQARGNQTLEGLLLEFAEVTGEHVLYSDETAVLLRNASTQLMDSITVAPQDVYSVVQGVLSSNRFTVVDVRRSEPRMLAIHSMDSSTRSIAKQWARFVPFDQLGDYEGDSALLIRTAQLLPNTDVRTLGNSLRMMVMDPNTLQMIPIAGSQTVVITGFGKDVNDLARLLQEVDRSSAKKHEQDEERQLEQALLKAAGLVGETEGD